MSIFDPRNEDDERLRNLLMFKMYATNEERDSMAPWMLLIAVLVVIIIWLIDPTAFSK